MHLDATNPETPTRRGRRPAGQRYRNGPRAGIRATIRQEMQDAARRRVPYERRTPGGALQFRLAEAWIDDRRPSSHLPLLVTALHEAAHIVAQRTPAGSIRLGRAARARGGSGLGTSIPGCVCLDSALPSRLAPMLIEDHFSPLGGDVRTCLGDMYDAYQWFRDNATTPAQQARIAAYERNPRDRALPPLHPRINDALYGARPDAPDAPDAQVEWQRGYLYDAIVKASLLLVHRWQLLQALAFTALLGKDGGKLFVDAVMRDISAPAFLDHFSPDPMATLHEIAGAAGVSGTFRIIGMLHEAAEWQRACARLAPGTAVRVGE